MKIGFFTDGYLPQATGVATSVYETAKELEARGHTVYIIAPKYPGYKDHNPHVYRLTSINIHEPTKTRISLNLPDKSLRQVLSLDLDVIHGHAGGPVTLLGWEIARAKKIPYIVTYHTLWNRYTHYVLKGKVVTPKMAEQATKILGNRVDYLIAPTERVEKELRRYGVKKPIKVVPSGIDIEKFNHSKNGFLRKTLKLKDEPIALFVGRLGREKSIEFLISSFKHVIKDIPNAQLVLVGEGEERKRLERLSEKLGISGNVRLLGQIDGQKMYDVYRDADVFVFASTSETQGLVIPEALASGVPVVVVNDPAYACVKNGENGFLVNKNEKEFAEKVVEVMTDKKKREAMSEKALESARYFSTKETAGALESVYFQLLERYNHDSVRRIMWQNELSEQVFVSSFIFWATILLVRILNFFSGVQNPSITISGAFYYLSSIGGLIALLCFAYYLTKKNVGLFPLVFMGLGLGLFANNIFALYAPSSPIIAYWSFWNLIPIIVFGALPSLLARSSNIDRPKFYITTRVQKHTNPDNPRITVVIPAYNEGEFIEPTLKSIINQSYKNFELLVVDNNSTDNTGEIAKNYGARVIVEKEKGVAAARNSGFKAASGHIVVSTDADSVVPESWLETIAENYKLNSKMVGFSGLNYLYSGPVTARAAGRYLFPIFWWIDRILNGGWNMCGFNMSVDKKAFDEIGGFTQGLKMGEDIDLSRKLRKVGPIGFDSNLRVFSSGRRFESGLFNGLMSYMPFYVSHMILKQNKDFEFKDFRGGNTGKKIPFLPLGVVVALAVAIFILANY